MDSSLRAVASEIYAAMRPPPPVTLTEWAEAHRVIPPPASEPGPYRSDRVPYMREIMTTMTDKSVRKVVVMKAGSAPPKRCSAASDISPVSIPAP